MLPTRIPLTLHFARPVRVLVSTAVAFGSSVAISIAAPSGNQILEQCNAAIRQADGARLNDQESVASLMCLSYLEGFLDGHAFDKVRLPNPLYCLPENGFTVGQFARMVVRTLKENPQSLHEDARLAVGLTLVRAFPCVK